MSSSAISSQVNHRVFGALETPSNDEGRNWFAVFTVPQNERSVVRHLDVRNVESFLPTYESKRVWKNRQKVTIMAPLFPTYLFVHIGARERGKVLQCPGVLQIVGGGRESIAIADPEIEFLRSACGNHRIEPCQKFEIGDEVRVKSGMLRGVQGKLVRKAAGMRFVITLHLINQHAAIQVDGEELERVVDESSTRPKYEASLERYRESYHQLKITED
jgi:transcription antitermination factor NusG